MFREEIAKVKEMRRTRNIEVGAKLSALGVELGIDFAADGLGRMNIARLMVEKGYAKDVQDAFNRFLGPGGKAYSDTRRTSPLEAVKLISAFGGLPVLAHPKKYLQQKTLRLLVEGLKPFGLKGIETYYPTHSKEDTDAIAAVADRYGLVRTGGSDYHGEEDKPLDYHPSPATLRALGVK